MSNVIASALPEVARIAGHAYREKVRYDHLTDTARQRTLEKRYEHVQHTASEELVEGVKLDNFVTREQIEAGTHILITEHQEYLEKIPVPLTPEELAIKEQAEAEHKQLMTKVWAGVAAISAVAISVAAVVINGQNKKHPAQSQIQ